MRDRYDIVIVGGGSAGCALANRLSRDGRLSAADRVWWRASNDWYEANCPNPARIDPTLFDRERHPVVSCWFDAGADAMLARVPGYLELLDRGVWLSAS